MNSLPETDIKIPMPEMKSPKEKIKKMDITKDYNPDIRLSMRKIDVEVINKINEIIEELNSNK